MGCRIGADSGPGGNGPHPGEATVALRGSLPAHQANGAHPSSKRRPPTSGLEEEGWGGGSLRSFLRPLDDVRQAQIRYVGRWGLGDDARRGQIEGSGLF